MSGVPITIPALPSVAPATADLVALWDTSAGIQGNATLTALGAIFATLTANTFTGDQTVRADILLPSADLGAGLGRRIYVDRNSNVTTAAPGVIYLTQGSGTVQRIWPDNSGNLRIGAVDPTSANITGGVVVGTQTSAHDQKDLLSDAPPDPVDVLGAIAQGAAAVRRFWYKAPIFPIEDMDGNITGTIEGERPGYGEVYSGVVLGIPDGPDAGRYGMDRDEAHPQGKSLNEITAIGDLLVAVNWLRIENDALRARVLALEEAAPA